MKILQVGKFYPIRGGVEKVMWDITEGLSERGICCDMLCAMLRGEKVDDAHASLATETEDGTVLRLNEFGRVICVPALRKVAATMISPAMVRWLRRHAAEYDIIHIHHPDPMAALALRLSGYRGRVILHWHSDILTRRLLLFFYKPLQSWLLRRAERIIGTTPVYLNESPVLAPYRSKTICVPIGIEPVNYDEDAAKAIRARYPGKKIIFSLGRLVPYKGFVTLVEAAALLSDDYMVLIGGGGPLREALEKRISELGLGEKVRLLGFLDSGELPANYGACDVFVMCSRWKTEAFGIVQIEAMSCGKPVVSTMIPQSGVSWVNEDGVSGLNVPVSDPEALAKAVERICSDPAKYAHYAREARRRFELLFTFSKMIDKTIEIYENRI